MACGRAGGVIGVPQGVSGGSFEPCGELRTVHPLFINVMLFLSICCVARQVVVQGK